MRCSFLLATTYTDAGYPASTHHPGNLGCVMRPVNLRFPCGAIFLVKEEATSPLVIRSSGKG